MMVCPALARAAGQVAAPVLLRPLHGPGLRLLVPLPQAVRLRYLSGAYSRGGSDSKPASARAGSERCSAGRLLNAQRGPAPPPRSFGGMPTQAPHAGGTPSLKALTAQLVEFIHCPEVATCWLSRLPPVGGCTAAEYDFLYVMEGQPACP